MLERRPLDDDIDEVAAICERIVKESGKRPVLWDFVTEDFTVIDLRYLDTQEYITTMDYDEAGVKSWFEDHPDFIDAREVARQAKLEYYKDRNPYPFPRDDV